MTEICVDRYIHKNESIDKLKHTDIKIIQQKENFRFGIDAFLLADFAKAGKKDSVVDLGCGSGVIPILMCVMKKGSFFMGVEIQEKAAKDAKRSVELNGLDKKISIINEDLKYPEKFIKKSSVNVVTANPPYMNANTGKINISWEKTVARHEVLCNLEDVIKTAATILMPNGRFFMIHKPFRLAEIFNTMSKYKLEPKTMQFVQPYADKSPVMVLIEARLNAKSYVKIKEPLVVYEKDGKYTKQVQDIYSLEKYH